MNTYNVRQPLGHIAHTVNVHVHNSKYILLTKWKGCTGMISSQGLYSTDQVQRGLYKIDQGLNYSPIPVPSRLG